MNVTFCAATEFEIQPLIDHLKELYIEHKPWQFTKGEKEIHVLITGVGSYATMYSLTKYLQHNRPQICIQAGIAGAFSRSLKIGDVVQVLEDQIVDLGANSAENRFIDIFEMGLAHPNHPPFSNGKLTAPEGIQHFLPTVNSISSNTVTGTQKGADFKSENYNADIESMEGASFTYVCNLEKLPGIQVRAISNYVEARDPDKWDIPGSIDALNKVLVEMLNAF